MSVRSLGDARAAPLRLSCGYVLGALVAVATAVHGMLALRSPSPWIVPDELVYSELAKSLGEGGLPRIRDELSFAYGLGYPLLLAPIWAVFDDVTAAYAVAKVVNALVLSLTAVPAFYLARRFVDERHSLLVAALTLAVPSLLYAGTLLTEVALYPATTLAFLAIAVALERPTRRSQVAALAAIALACSVKMLAIVLLPAYLVAIALYCWLDTRDARAWTVRLRAYRATWLVAAVGAGIGVVAATVAGRSPGDALGAYAVVLGNIDPLAVPWWAVVHLAELDLYLGVVPAAAAALVVAHGFHGLDRAARLFAAVALPSTACLIIVAAAVSSDDGPGVSGHASSAGARERATFLLAPLFFTALAIWLSGRRDLAPRRLVYVIGLGAALLPMAIPLGQLVANVRFQALALVLWVTVDDVLPWRWVALPLTLGLGLAFVLFSRRLVPAAVPAALVFAVLALTGLVAQGPIQWGAERTREQAWGDRANWVDAAVGSSASVSVLWAEPPGEAFVDPAPRHRVLWIGEIFNRSIGPVYEIGSPMAYALPTERVRVAADGVVTSGGVPLDVGPLVLVPCHVRPEGEVVAIDRQTGAAVYRLRRPLRVTISEPGGCGGGAG